MRPYCTGVSRMAWCAALVAAFALAPEANAAPTDRFVVIVANNRSIESGVQDLQFADDDGIQFYRLFRRYAGEVHLLSVLDEQTQRMHRGVAAQTTVPTVENLKSTLARVYRDIRSLADSARSELVFLFVGHGSVDLEGKGYIHLQDGRFSRADLYRDVISASPAGFTHVIVDACHAFSFVAGRGQAETPTAEQMQLAATFFAGHDLEEHPTVGVLLSTSDSRETYEWSRIQGGVFSHQLRSALSGAADVNRDGLIEYSEVAGFVGAASLELNTHGRAMRVFAWPPRQNRSVPLVDLREARDSRFLAVGGTTRGRYYLEDSRGGRHSEFHKSEREDLLLSIPSGERYFLRNDDFEVAIPAGDEVFAVDEPPTKPVTLAHRGAADEAFRRGLFAVPFTRGFYLGFVSSRGQYVLVAPTESPFWPRVGETAEASSEDDAGDISSGGDPGIASSEANAGDISSGGDPGISSSEGNADNASPYVNAGNSSSEANAGDISSGGDSGNNWELAAGYQLGTFALKPRRLEHGARLGVAYRLTDLWRLTGAVEAGTVALDQLPSERGYRVGVMPGLEAGWRFASEWRVAAALETGWALFSLTGDVASADGLVWGSGLLLTLAYELSPSFAVQLSGAGQAFLVTIDGSEQFRTSLMGSASILIGL